MNHTPGPWKVGRDSVIYGNADTGKIFVLPIEEDRPDDPFAKEICFVQKGADTNSEADARLIAAAPELLDAIKDALENCETCRANEYTGTDRCCRCLTFEGLVNRADE